VRRKLAQYDALVVEITPDAILTPATDDDPAKRDAYSVLDDSDGGLTLDVGRDHERVAVMFLDKDHISLGLRSGAFRLTRDGAATTASIAPSGEDAAAPRARATGARDACSDYADCIDQMPRLRGDESIMTTSSTTIRSWERTPERLKQCASALETARAGGLCR
jgi:hypothetical protein